MSGLPTKWGKVTLETKKNTPLPSPPPPCLRRKNSNTREKHRHFETLAVSLFHRQHHQPRRARYCQFQLAVMVCPRRVRNIRESLRSRGLHQSTSATSFYPVGRAYAETAATQLYGDCAAFDQPFPATCATCRALPQMAVPTAANAAEADYDAAEVEIYLLIGLIQFLRKASVWDAGAECCLYKYYDNSMEVLYWGTQVCRHRQLV